MSKMVVNVGVAKRGLLESRVSGDPFGELVKAVNKQQVVISRYERFCPFFGIEVGLPVGCHSSRDE